MVNGRHTILLHQTAHVELNSIRKGCCECESSNQLSNGLMNDFRNFAISCGNRSRCLFCSQTISAVKFAYAQRLVNVAQITYGTEVNFAVYVEMYGTYEPQL
jgi:hypothetical protein